MESPILDYLDALTCGDDEGAEAAVAGIAAIPAQHAQVILERLRGLLDDPSADTRWWATRAIAALSDPSILPLLVRALDDQCAAVRQCAALSLRFHPDIRAVPALVTTLSDDDDLVARLASDALANTGEAAVPALLEVMNSEACAARLHAVRALAKIGDHRSIPALFTALDEDSALMEYWATEGLERMGVGMMLFSPD